MKQKAYVYVGEPISDLDGPEYREFLLHLEKCILYSLEKRDILTHSQTERCIKEIKKVHTKDCSKHRA